jgi:hypothetical protein
MPASPGGTAAVDGLHDPVADGAAPRPRKQTAGTNGLDRLRAGKGILTLPWRAYPWAPAAAP